MNDAMVESQGLAALGGDVGGGCSMGLKARASRTACYIFSAMMPTIGGVERNAAGFCSRLRHSVSNSASSAVVNRPHSTSCGT